MELLTKLRETVSLAREYVELRLTDIRLEAIDKISTIAADVTASLVFATFCMLSVLFISISAALYFNYVLHSPFLGFLIVAGIFVLSGFIIYVTRKQLIKRPVREWMISKIAAGEKSTAA